MSSHLNFWQLAVRHTIKKGGVSSEGEDFMSRESYLGLPLEGTPTDISSNNPFAGFCIKQEGLVYSCNKAITRVNADDTLLSILKDFKHIAQLYHADPSSKLVILNNQELIDLPFKKKNAKNLVECI
jgi:hypothetical protein